MAFLPLFFRSYIFFLYIHSFHDYFFFRRNNFGHFPCFAFVFARHYFHRVSFFYFHKFITPLPAPRKLSDYILFLEFLSESVRKFFLLTAHASLCPKARRHSHQT